jgi:hypothetical protein
MVVQELRLLLTGRSQLTLVVVGLEQGLLVLQGLVE